MSKDICCKPQAVNKVDAHFGFNEKMSNFKILNADNLVDTRVTTELASKAVQEEKGGVWNNSPAGEGVQVNHAPFEFEYYTKMIFTMGITVQLSLQGKHLLHYRKSVR